MNYEFINSLSADIASVSFALGPEIVRIRMGLCQVRGQAWDRSCAAASTLPAARAAVADIVSSGRGDGPRWNAADLLATLGVDLPAIQRQMRAEYGPHAIAELYRSPVGRHLPWGPLCGPQMAPGLKKALFGSEGRASFPTSGHALLSLLEAGSRRAGRGPCGAGI